MIVPELRLLHHHQSQMAAPGGVSPRPERQAMRNAAAEFAARGPSASVSISLEAEFQSTADAAEDVALRRIEGRGQVERDALAKCGVHITAMDYRDALCVVGDKAGRLVAMEADTMEMVMCVGAYVAVIDPLKSVEVAPAVHSVALMPRLMPAAYVLCSNEKVPKLYKVIHTRDCPAPKKATDFIGSTRVGPLTLPQNRAGMKHVATFAMEHEYRIHSALPLHDGARFLSVDDVEARLWCTEFTDVPLDVVSIKPRGEEEPKDTFLSAYVSPFDPVLFIVTTFSGLAQVFDIRQRLKWSADDCLRFANDVPPDQPPCVVSCAHSPCGNLIAGRDATSVLLWDTRKSQLLHRWEVQPLDERVLGGRSDVRFSESGRQIFAGTERGAMAVVQVSEQDRGARFVAVDGCGELPLLASRERLPDSEARSPLAFISESRGNKVAVAGPSFAQILECT